MENPAQEICSVIQRIAVNTNPSLQSATIQRYFTPDASLRNYVCSVPHGPRSRETIIGLYNCYHFLSPHTRVDVRDIVYNSTRDPPELFVRVLQLFDPRWSPFSHGYIPLLIQLELKAEPSADGGPTKYLIASQEDFYHPDDVVAFTFPPAQHLARIALRVLAGVFSVLVRVLEFIGFWRMRSDELGGAVDLQHEGVRRASKRSERFKQHSEAKDGPQNTVEAEQTGGDGGEGADTEDNEVVQKSEGARHKRKGVRPSFKAVAMGSVEEKPVEPVKGVVAFEEKTH
ncbi:hypothetical protein OBBRIDRAFT_834113 [Obba rivulosa]|uniref:SigF-like NTF2-like domain-containing protein n=1 Tax=Obba rivulosa TaxID=1052685 RepID=A0A8E2DMV7_9APHY|nr:hypothetical protein OBBRIDRAFT_834113 [Obba rivulosa]